MSNGIYSGDALYNSLSLLKTTSMKSLKTPREVMEAFLRGSKLVNNRYGAREYDDKYTIFLCMKNGRIVEEDGAGAKDIDVPMTFRDETTKWWELEDNEWEY